MSTRYGEASYDLDQPYDDKYQAEGVVETVIRDGTTTARHRRALWNDRLGLCVRYKEHPDYQFDESSHP